MSDWEKKAALKIQHEILNLLGEEAIEVIKERVAEGKGLDDAPMPPYKGGKTGHRDLKETGQMLDSMIFEKKPDQVLIRFSNAFAEKKARFNQEIHPWFGLSQSDLNQLTKRIQKKWMKKS